MRHGRDADGFPSRWPVFAATLLIAALFGFISGVIRDVHLPRGVQSAVRDGDTPHLYKREPFRALAAADRKEPSGPYSASGDGILAPPFVDIPLPDYVTASARISSFDPAAFSFWQASLPRGPPRRA